MMEMNRKPRPQGPIILIIVLIIMCVGLLGYIFYPKIKNNIVGIKITKTMEDKYGKNLFKDLYPRDFTKEVPIEISHLAKDNKISIKEGTEYCNFYFNINDEDVLFRGIADSKGNVYVDSYVSYLYSKDVESLLIKILDEKGEMTALKDKNYLLFSYPHGVKSVSGPYDDFNDFNERIVITERRMPYLYICVDKSVTTEDIHAINDILIDEAFRYTIEYYAVDESIIEDVLNQIYDVNFWDFAGISKKKGNYGPYLLEDK